MKHQINITLISIMTLIALLVGASNALAHSEPSSDLLLPFFEVDMSGTGVTTFFAVVNSSPEPVNVKMTVHSNWGIEIMSTSATLQGDEVKTINLTEWVMLGKLLDRSLTSEELDHCQAALSGQLSPTDNLYYSSEIDFGKATGYVTIRSEGASRPDVLFGDYFVVNGSQDSAQGEVLINIDPSHNCSDICERHGLRYLLGAGFDEGTEVLIWTGRRGKAQASAYFPADQKTGTDILVYKQSGELVDQHFLGLQPLEVLTVGELGLAVKFGWLDLETEHPTFMAVRHSAQNRFSVALQTACLPKKTTPDPDPTPRIGIHIEKSTNGVDADEPTGPRIPVGDSVLWEYVVRNTEDVTLSDIEVSDDQGVSVSCPKTVLAPGETMVCTASGTAVAGQYRNVGTVVGWSAEGERVEDSDPSHYFGEEPLVAEPAIDIEKATNGLDADTAPGPGLTVGDAVTWTYVVTNTGDTSLSSVSVSDDQGVSVSCPKTTLALAESMTCTGGGTATLGQYRNIGTVTGQSPSGQTAEDSDPSHYNASGPILIPAIDIEKATNGQDADVAPGPTVTVGDSVTWTYVVTNSGPVDLLSIGVSDDQGVAVSCPKSQLVAGESMTCTGQGTATEGQYKNIGTVDAVDAQGTPVSDSDPSHYFGEGEVIIVTDQGCTPGYWKNHIDSWAAAGFSPNATVEQTFGSASAYDAVASATLHQALNFGGGAGVDGAARNLLRAGVAALLNAAHPGVGYPNSLGGVSGDVNGALASGDRDSMLSTASSLDADNNGGCPLN